MLEPLGDLPPLPRLGWELVLDPALGHMRWFGYGPHESYPDRRSSVWLGWHEGSVEDQYEPQIKPQDNGNKCGVRYVSFADDKGHGLAFAFESPANVKASRFSPKHLAETAHMHDLVPDAAVHVCLDAFVMGLGGASCGPPPLERYRTIEWPLRLAFTLMRV
jgi:hypothetical protein